MPVYPSDAQQLQYSTHSVRGLTTGAKQALTAACLISFVSWSYEDTMTVHAPHPPSPHPSLVLHEADRCSAGRQNSTNNTDAGSLAGSILLHVRLNDRITDHTEAADNETLEHLPCLCVVH